MNQAIGLTFKDKQDDPNKPKKVPQHVAFIVICKGTPFYGYAVGHDAFLKVYLTQPSLKKRTADLLRHGAILGKQYDVGSLLCSGSPTAGIPSIGIVLERGGWRVALIEKARLIQILTDEIAGV